MASSERGVALVTDEVLVPLGRWQTTAQGRFLWMDASLRTATSLPLIPVTQLRWADLVLPGTDLTFFELASFTRREVHVGVAGGIRRWLLSGTRSEHDGAIDGIVHLGPPRPGPQPGGWG